MLFRELNHGKCKTYLIACENTRKAVLVDPLLEKLEPYLAFLTDNGLKLDTIVDTHTHADHRTGSLELKHLTDARVVMHRSAPSPHVDTHVRDGATVTIGEIPIKVLHTPGHTPDSISLHVKDRVLTGDTLFIGGTGRCDFSGGDPGAQFTAITEKLFRLPGETLVFPGHDYRGNTKSTICHEREFNPRLRGRTRKEYIELMNNLGLPLPNDIQEVLQPNQSALEDDQIQFPTLIELNRVRQLTPKEVQALTEASPAPLVIDVREPEEYSGELGHIQGSVLIPLKELPTRAGELEAYKEKQIIVLCRAGARSTTAAAILTGLGFEQVSNLKGGMVQWNDRQLPVTR